MSFESDLEKFLKQPAIAKQMRAHYAASGGSVADIAEVKTYVDRAVHILVDSLPIALRTGPQAITYSDMEYAQPVLGKDGFYTVELRWVPKEVQRESLYRSEYPEGIENIVALHSTGYVASKPVYGFWRGHRTNYNVTGTYGPYGGWAKSAQIREPDPFISFAVSTFNRLYGQRGVTLIAPDEYY